VAKGCIKHPFVPPLIMSSPVAIKISRSLAEAAREEGEVADRSLTGQIEHWAKLGRAVEARLPAGAASELKRAGLKDGTVSSAELDRQVEEAFATYAALPPAKRREQLGLDRESTFEPDPEDAQGLIRVDPDGTRTRGRRRGRTFVPRR